MALELPSQLNTQTPHRKIPVLVELAPCAAFLESGLGPRSSGAKSSPARPKTWTAVHPHSPAIAQFRRFLSPPAAARPYINWIFPRHSLRESHSTAPIGLPHSEAIDSFPLPAFAAFSLISATCPHYGNCYHGL